MSTKDSLDTTYEALVFILGSQREVDTDVIYTHGKAFDAALAYEKNCRLKYDRPGQQSLAPKKGEFMSDYALMYGTTVQEMKACELQVDAFLGIND